ncbi:MAG: YbaK/EbsC family protein [Gammaproteobacteria bacterium]|nr:YbaK/EbsC family protein [Gammaproteobacteria bacterium]NNF61516.1 YbaK/EbsC family protein [Gammaproteobacteria bacterium]
MTIPARVLDYVEEKKVDCTVVPHPRSESSLETAHSAHISGEQLAKAVLLTASDSYVLAVLPASHELQISRAEDYFGTDLKLAPESDLPQAFDDCTPGAVPALGGAYGIKTIVDKMLTMRSDVYFEAGDHEDLIRVSSKGFRELMADADYAHISEHK